jgi:hypothetical protein
MPLIKIEIRIDVTGRRRRGKNILDDFKGKEDTEN